MELTSNGILEIVLAIITLVVGWGIKQFGSWMKAKEEQIQEKTGSEVLVKYMKLASDHVVDIVKSLNQTIVNDIKEKSADGKLTEEEKKKVLNTAIEYVQNILSADAMLVLQEAIGDVDLWLLTQINKTVSDEKSTYSFSSGINSSDLLKASVTELPPVSNSIRGIKSTENEPVDTQVINDSTSCKPIETEINTINKQDEKNKIISDIESLLDTFIIKYTQEGEIEETIVNTLISIEQATMTDLSLNDLNFIAEKKSSNSIIVSFISPALQPCLPNIMFSIKKR